MNPHTFNPKRVVIVGASGAVGAALAEHIQQRYQPEQCWCLSRQTKPENPPSGDWVSVDYFDESDLKDSLQSCSDVDLVVVATGILHSPQLKPEKALRHLQEDQLLENFRINTVLPSLMMKHLLPKMTRSSASVFAALSARVSSLEDNNLGGWYGYRASKAALNMMIKTASIEQQRTHPNCVVCGLHPGTVESPLSAPFTTNLHHDVFSPQQSADHLLNVIDQLLPQHSGRLLAWDGQLIPY